ncbi:MAG TPA: alkaline phosphatase family protein [Rubricoccaceae bacterium]|jgi:hypothetical protein
MRLTSLAVFAVPLFLSGCSGLAGTIDEASEMLAAGGERELREPMRPVRGTERVLILAFDGIGDPILREALRDGSLPALSALLGPTVGDNLWAHGYAAPRVASVYPAETTAGWAAVYTGRPPAETGIAGNEWFSRDSLRVFAPVPLSVGTVEQTLKIYSDDILGQLIQTPTLFELADVRAFVSMGFVSRGADRLMPPDLNDVTDLAEAAVNAVVGGVPSVYKVLDDDTREGVDRGADRYGLPDLQVAYFPGVDLVAHAEGGEAQRAYIREVLGPRVEDILGRYREQGLMDHTTVVVVADHGHTASLADDRHSLGGDSDADEPPALLDSLGLRTRDFTIAEDSSDFNVVMTYDEATAMLYLADRSTCPDTAQVCDWSRPPRLEEDVLPVARAFRDASASGDSTRFGLGGALDLVFVRASDPSGRTDPPFRVLDGDRLVPVPEYLASNPRPDLVRLEERLHWLTDGPFGHHAGDIILLAKAGDQRPLEERFYFGTPRSSGHGSASESDAYIPLLLARQNRTGEQLQQAVTAAVGVAPTQLDVTPLVLRLLGR